MTECETRKRATDNTSDEVLNKHARLPDDDQDHNSEEVAADKNGSPRSDKTLSADTASATADEGSKFDERAVELKTKVSTSTCSYFTDAMCTRFNTINSHLNLKSGCATLNTVPIDCLGWSPCLAELAHINLKMYDSDCRVFFHHKQGVKFKPLVAKDEQVLHAILLQLSLGESGMQLL
ncbi:hypothetical protein NM688_g4781 [Phlebia brevispora]|uniref:Uncharacterized protein n=1 Tax=Phlebia brevispora TaxID=194682 RepID=A0ACC1T282_9APHY|nr:hypothetical protein NM688_g4781 [Phlebia brevispora]